MDIVVVGDSFSSDTHSDSWVTLLAQHHSIKNFSQRGISEYRILKIIREHADIINQADGLIICHTNPDRIYIPNEVDYPTRNKNSHPYSDMVASDALASTWKNNAEVYYRNFYDQDLQKDLFDFSIAEMQRIITVKILNFSLFDTQTSRIDITSFSDIRQKFPGKINHLDTQGNQQVFNTIQRRISHDFTARV